MATARTSPLVVVFLVVFLDLLAFGVILPLLPFYALHFGLTPVGAGVLMATYSLGQLAFAPVWGRLSDRVGRRPVILASLAGSVASLLAFGLASSALGLFAARAFAGIAGANIATAQAYVADVTTRENRARGMGAVGAGIGLGFVLGPAVGGFFGQWGFALPSFVAAGLAAVNLVLAWRLLPESRAPGAPPTRFGKSLRPSALAAALRRPGLGPLLVAGFLAMLAFSAMESTFAFWSRDVFGWTSRETGYLFTYIGVVVAVVQGGLIGPLTRRFGPERLLLAGLLLLGAALALLPTSDTVAPLLATVGVLAFANGLAQPTLSGLLSLHAPDDAQGGILGLSQGLAALARVLGPLWGPAAFVLVAPSAPYYVGGFLMLAAAAVAFAATGKRPAEAGPVASDAL